MKTKGEYRAGFFREMLPDAGRPIVLGILGVALGAGCSTDRTVGLVRGGGTPPVELARLEPGVIVVSTRPQPARLGYDAGNGRLESAGEAAGTAARKVLTVPPLGDSSLEAIAGPIGVAMAPFAATYGALRAGHKNAPANKLHEAEADLVRAMTAMANQEELRKWFMRAAGKNTRYRFIMAEERNQLTEGESVSAIIETGVEDLKVERRGANDSTFGLSVRVRTRVLRASDGAVVYDAPYEYRSREALFIDWTRRGGLESVAQTGYRALAEQMVASTVAVVPDQPMLLGAGYKNAPSRAAKPAQVTSVAGYICREQTAQLRPAVHQISSSSLGIYSTGSVPRLVISSRPLTKDEAVIGAQEDTDRWFGELAAFPNSVISLTAFAAAIPYSLGKQTAGAIQGVPKAKRDASEVTLEAAVRETRPHKMLAQEVARSLALQTSQSVILVRQPIPPQGERDPDVMHCLAQSTLSWLPTGQSAGEYLTSQGADSALEIRVDYAGLSAKSEGINPPMALSMDGQATLYRTADGKETYTCPVHYRSKERKYTEWAAQDAKLFREELDRCYRAMSESIAKELVAQRLVAPGKGMVPTVASK